MNALPAPSTASGTHPLDDVGRRGHELHRAEHSAAGWKRAYNPALSNQATITSPRGPIATCGSSMPSAIGCGAVTCPSAVTSRSTDPPVLGVSLANASAPEPDAEYAAPWTSPSARATDGITRTNAKATHNAQRIMPVSCPRGTRPRRSVSEACASEFPRIWPRSSHGPLQRIGDSPGNPGAARVESGSEARHCEFAARPSSSTFRSQRLIAIDDECRRRQPVVCRQFIRGFGPGSERGDSGERQSGRVVVRVRLGLPAGTQRLEPLVVALLAPPVPARRPSPPGRCADR